jgi:hypothetical protein
MLLRRRSNTGVGQRRLRCAGKRQTRSIAQLGLFGHASGDDIVESLWNGRSYR